MSSNRSTSGSGRSSRAESRSARVHSVSSEGTPIRYHVYLRLFLEARYVFLVQRGGQTSKQSETRYEHVLSWAELQGFQHLYAVSKDADAQDSSSTSPMAGPLRRLFKAILATADKYSTEKNMGIERPEPSSPSILQYIKGVRKGIKMLSQIYKYAMYILPFTVGQGAPDTRAMDFYFALCDKYGETELIEGESPIKTFCLRTWPPIKYFEAQYFPVKPSRGRGQQLNKTRRFLPPTLLLMFKLAVDSTLFCVRRGKRGRKTKSSAIPDTTWACTSLSMELIYYAWNAFSNRIGLSDVDELLSPFVYFNRVSGKLEAVPEGRCIPSTHQHRLCAHPSSGEVPSESEGDNVQPAVPAVGVESSSTEIVPLLQKISPSTIEKLRQFAQDFLGDIYGDAVSKEVKDCVPKEVEHVSQMKKFLLVDPDEDGLPSRFLYDAGMLAGVRREVNNARLANVPDDGISLDPTSEPAPPTAAGSLLTASLSPAVPIPPGNGTRHVCDENCNCKELRDRCISRIVNLPMLLPCSFSDLLPFIESDMSNPPVRGNVQLILTDPPYNIRRRQGRSNSDHDKLARKDMRKVVDTCCEMLRPGGHLVLFCAAHQFGQWEKVIEEHRASPTSQPSFHMTKTPLVFVPKLGHYSRPPFYTNLTHMNITEFAVHAVRRVRPGQHREALQMVSWIPHGHIESTYPPHTNVIDGYYPLTPGESLQVLNTATSSTSTTGGNMLRPEQKSLGLMKELVAQYSRPGDIVVDPFSGTATTAVACISLPEYRAFYGCDLDGVVLQHGVNRMLDAYIYYTKHRTLPPQLHVPDDMKDSITTLYERNNFQAQPPRGLPSHYTLPDVDVPRRSPTTTRLPMYLLEFLNTFHRSTNFTHKTILGLTPDRYPSNIQGLLNNTPQELLHLIALSHEKLYLLGEGSEGTTPGGLASMRDLESGSVIGHVFGTLFYSPWSQAAARSRSYGTGLYAVREADYDAKKFPIVKPDTTVQVEGMENEGDSTKRVLSQAYLVPARHCPFRFARYSTYSNPTYNAAFRVRCHASPNLATFTDPTNFEVIAKVAIPKSTPIVICPDPEFYYR